MKQELRYIELDNVVIATTFLNRLKGLMGKKEITKGMAFPKCNSIHTFFMRSAIDVIMIEKTGKVLYLYEKLQPNRIIPPKKNVDATIELAPGTIQKLGITKDSNIRLEKNQ